MWLSGLALWAAGVVPEAKPEGPHVDPESLTARESAIGVLPLAFVISAMVSVAYGLLLRLFSGPAALGGALLIALDPFFIANSKVFHVDGLLSAFCVVSALALLVFLRDGRGRWIVLSGFLGGLALLTKSPSLFLLPYVALCLGVAALSTKRVSWRTALYAGTMWLAFACVTYIAIYPAMWADPVGTVRTVYSRAALRLEWAHPSPLYFLGSPVVGDPGLAYYPVAWACKLSAVASVFGLLAVLIAALKRERAREERLDVVLLLAFVVFFTLQMTIGAKKLPRYLLPAFPVVDIMAGVGLVWAAEAVLPQARRSPAAPGAMVGAVLALQAVVVLARHPYYGTHFNELVGPRTGIWALSTQWQGEGLDRLARTLNQVPYAEGATAGSHMPTLFRQYFQGRTVEVDERADWYAFGINNAMRHAGSEDGLAWDYFRRRSPDSIVSFGQVEYAWLYAAALGPDTAVEYEVGDAIRLVGYDLASGSHSVGDLVRLQLYWEARETLQENYTIFVHLVDGQGRLVSQQDNQPVRGTHPTSRWQVGEMVIDPYDVPIPDGLSPQTLSVVVGAYRWPSGDRLEVRAADGARLPDDVVVLTAVEVALVTAQLSVWAARLLAAVVFAYVLFAMSRRTGSPNAQVA
jgi:4-amino-4-deoxy-L-arabinose transferase-like glycosyltransferase